ncbi:helix-turn-helix transcriptional regulator [Shimia thalassica]|uniref:helix-turn-helix domain-containing protein n=1 Tax=Shimia thalassica TaxID=1715693 RepID=UPI001C08AE97|nr:helix-turn-helix transcriptional regulator [Shimia thalassica]MBU2943151.1 helix-turn-helix domain-containing protein [Shimia thalassica]MDO6504222.1 helix-turn-helix transcriptional regulator [Shimia thalassica]
MSANYDPNAMRERLQKALDDKRMSMRKASLDSGLSETALHGIIKLGRDPGTMNLVKICDTLGISVAWVMYGYDVSIENDEILQLLQKNPSKQEAILALLRE